MSAGMNRLTPAALQTMKMVTDDGTRFKMGKERNQKLIVRGSMNIAPRAEGTTNSEADEKTP